MSSHNRRRGPSNRRPAYLQPAPSPDDQTSQTQASRALIREPAPRSSSTQTIAPAGERITVVLDQDEYFALLDRADAAGARLLETHDDAALSNSDNGDDDARLPNGGLPESDDITSGHPESVKTNASAASSSPSPPPDSDVAPAIAAGDDDDPDPFEQLALAGDAPRARTVAPAGSASIDIPPSTRAHHRSRSNTDAGTRPHRQRRTAGRRSLRRAGALGAVAIASGLVIVTILLGGSSSAPRRASDSQAATALAAPELTAHSDPFAVGYRLTAPAVPRSAHPRAARRRPASHHSRTRPRMHRHTATAVTGHASAATQDATAADSTPAAATADPTVTNTPSVSERSASPPAQTTNTSSANPPAYGEGGILGAGHIG